MRPLAIVAVTLVLIGCGESRPGGATTTPTAARTPDAAAGATGTTGAARPAAGAAGPWSTRRSGSRRPLRCPASSSRARWPSRVLRRTDGTFVKLRGRRPRLAEVTATGALLRQTELGARKPADVRALACGRGERLAVAWTEWLGEGRARLWLWLNGERARVLDTAEAPYDDAPIGDIALNFGDDGSLLVAYSVYKQVRAVRVTDGAVGAPFVLGPAFEVTQVVAEGDVVAWTTIDGGEERNERRRVYAVRGGGKPQLVQRAPRRVLIAKTGQSGTELRLSVAPNGRAALLWGVDRAEFDEYSVWAAEAPPGRRFRQPRRVGRDGKPGDVAIRSNGTVLAVFEAASELRARLHEPGTPFGPPETIAQTDEDAVAGFDRTRPRVEWRGGVSVRG